MEFRPPHSKVKDGSKSYPRFAPHITLATFADLPPALDIDDLPIFGRDLKPPVLNYVSWKQGDTYLGALSLKLSQPRELLRLHRAITDYLDALRVQWKSRNFPHMSLFYVDESKERIRLVEALGHYLKRIGTSNVDNRTLDRHNRSTPFTRFTGAEVWLVDCTRSVRQWRVMEKRKLSFSPEKPLSDVPSMPDEPSSTSLSKPYHEEMMKQEVSFTKHNYEPHPTAPPIIPGPIRPDPTVPASVHAQETMAQSSYQPIYITSLPIGVSQHQATSATVVSSTSDSTYPSESSKRSPTVLHHKKAKKQAASIGHHHKHRSKIHLPQVPPP